MTESVELSRLLARFVQRTRYEDLPPEVVEFTKLCILDWLSSALAGERSEPVRMIRKMATTLGGQPQATVLGAAKSSVLNAALVNGAASHVVELDDIHKASIIHAATVVIPAALAIAEWKRCSGKDLITAIAVGYDVCYRIGEAVSPSHYHYWHNTATCGTFGAAAAAAKLLRLSESQIVHALGSAGTQAAGLWEFIEDGAMSKQLHTGKAAMNGVIAALLAENGFTGASRILEGRRGFFEAMSERYDSLKITEGLGEKLKITENSFKIHASCRHTHPAIDLILDVLRERDVTTERVASIRIDTYRTALDITDNPDPRSVYAAKFSLQYCAALALLRRSAGLHDFDEPSLLDPNIRAWMKCIEVGVDPELDSAYPLKWGARLKIRLQSGEILERVTEYPKGDPENPVTGELADKFRDMNRDREPALLEGYIARVSGLETLEDAGMFFEPVRNSELRQPT